MRTRCKPSTSGKDINMNKELYEELRKIKDRLYDIASENDNIFGIFDSKLGEAWCALCSYLEEVKPD